MPAASTVNEVTGIAGQSRNSFINRLQDKYLPAWDDHVHSKTKLAQAIAQKKGTMDGVRSLTSLMTAYPASAGVALFEGDTLPVPTAGTYINPSIMARYIHTRLRWTWQVEKAARAGKGAAWAGPRREDMEAARKQLGINFERMLFGGPLQILGDVSSGAAPASSQIVVTLYNRDARTSAAADRWKFGAHYFRLNQGVSYIDASGTTPQPLGNPAEPNTTAGAGNEMYVVSIDTSGTNPTVTLARRSGTTTLPTLTDGDLLIPFRSRAESMGSDDADFDSNLAGPNGLLNLIVNSSYKAFVYGLSRTTNTTLSGFVFDNSGTTRAWDERYVQLAVDRIQDDGTGDDPDCVFMHSSVRREYVRETTGDRRFEPVQSKKGQAAKLQFSAGDTMLEVKTARDCPPGLAFVLDTSSFGWFSEAELQMVDDGERFVSDQAAHEIVLMKSGNEACTKPHNNAVVEDISYSTSGLTS